MRRSSPFGSESVSGRGGNPALGTLSPPGQPVVVCQQPRFHGADGEPETEAWRRIGGKLPHNRTGARLRVEVTKNEQAMPILRGNHEPMHASVERILPCLSAQCNVVLPLPASGSSDQPPRNRGIDRPLAAIVNRQRHSTIPAGRSPRAGSAATPPDQAASQPSPPARGSWGYRRQSRSRCRCPTP